MKILGIDFGTKNIGIAISDVEGRVAFPKDTYKRDEDIVSIIEKLVNDEGVGKVVLGMPKDVPDEWKKEVEAFSESLKSAGLDVVLQDESFSSHEAHHTAHDFGLKLKDTDSVAAAFILQRYLERQQDH